MWIVDFGVDMPHEEARPYERPSPHVKPCAAGYARSNKRQAYRERWWIHVEPRPAMRRRFGRLERFLATTTVSKHRLFVWSASPILPDQQLIVFAQCDDCFFGVLQSRAHEVWGLRQGTRLEESGFVTLRAVASRHSRCPSRLPEQAAAIAAAAKETGRTAQRLAEPAGVDEDGGAGVSRLGGRAVGAVYRSGHGPPVDRGQKPSPSTLSRTGRGDRQASARSAGRGSCPRTPTAPRA